MRRNWFDIGRTILKNTSVILITCLISTALSACNLSMQSDFPAVPNESSLVSQPSSSPSDPDVLLGEDDSQTDRERVVLRLAGPWQSSELDLLGRYFELSKGQVTTLSHDDLMGSQISLDWLSGYASDLKLIAIPLSLEDQLTDDLAREWTAADNWPDLVMTDCFSPVQASQLVDLTPYLVDESLLAADHVIVSMLYDCESPQGLKYLPWRITVPVLYHNPAVFPEYDSNGAVSFENWQDFIEMCRQLAMLDQKDGSDYTEYEASRLVLANPESLLPIFQFDQERSVWAGWDGKHYDFSSPEFANNVKVLRQLVDSGATLADPSIDLETYQAANKVLLDRKQVAFWLTDSSQISQGITLPAEVQVLPLPSAESESASYPVRIHALSVSKSSNHPALASEIAAFLGYDSEAIALQMRLNAFPGYFPVVRDPDVWWIALNQIPGQSQALTELQKQMTYFSAGGQFKTANWNQIQDLMADSYAYKLLSESDTEANLLDLQNIADQKEE